MVLETERLVQVLSRIREKRPIVHTITNWVTANEVAGCLHAIGARPIMATATEEIEEITSKAEALVLNLGTPSPKRLEAMLLSGRQANRDNHPIVFDPVGVGASAFRIESSRRILSELRVAVIRGNQSEIGVLAGQKSHLAGVDSVSGPEDLEQASRQLSEKTGAVVVASGPEDLIVSSEKRVVVYNGHPMMPWITGMGCMLSAIIGAFNAVESNRMMATVSAVAFFGLAGEQAGLFGKGPGTFKTALFDALHSLTPEQMQREMKLRS